MALGKNIERARKAKGLSQPQLSRMTGWSEDTPRVGVSQGAISVLEVRNSKSSKFAPALAKALNVPLDELITGEFNIQQQKVIYKTIDPVLEDLAALPQEDADVWRVRIRAAAIKARQQQMEKSDRKDAAKAPDPPIDKRRTA